MKGVLNQQNRIIRYLLDNKSITSLEAMQELGVYRLSARISELKQKGYSINKKSVKGINRYGETIRFAEYSLEEYDKVI